MNEKLNNLNLVDILKDCPKGTKLYSPIYGEVIFEGIVENVLHHPIKVLTMKNDVAVFDLNGRYDSIHDGECMLFPSKDQRDWSKFKVESKFDISTLQPFDKVLGRDCNDEIWLCSFYCHYDNDELFPFRCLDYGYKQCVPYNDETKHLIGTTEMPPMKYITWEE